MVKNYGLVIPSITNKEEGAEHILGAEEPIINSSAIWNWLRGEPQRVGGVDSFACVPFNTVRGIETLIEFKTGVKVNYLKRYLANVAKFKGILDPKSGSDPHKIAELIRTVAGLLKEGKLIEWDESIKTSEDYYNLKDIELLIKEGQEWWNEWELRHKWVWSSNPSPEEKQRLLKSALQRGTVCVSVVAWKERNGLYYKERGEMDGHWTGLERYDGENPIIEDSYPESEGDFEKVLELNYDFGIAKVYYLSPVQEKLSILAKILEAIKKILGIQSQLIDKISIDKSPPPPVELPKYNFSTPELARHSVRVICDEEGLSLEIKNRLTETIKCESNFNPNAINENKNSEGRVTSRDIGIAQINNFFHIGPGKPFPTSSYVLDNPEACIRWMAQMFKAGKANLWTCYKRIYG